ncbi:hypothetical protein G1H10_13460 [Phytoactinopolyspora halotolerans]|uniref:Type II secretion system protein GspF domain-containing protein n=2 Tax=Phytoactinopolyspora halotolerans TaxID=1981512 RepID=A0A6L9S6T5_9ACTN|nr:hypothetical protein [Phytoactinopolyspora halotolerans]
MCLLGGLMTLAVGLARVPVDRAKPALTWRHRARRLAGATAGQRRCRAVYAGAVLVGAMAWLATGWVLAVLAVPAAAIGLPFLLQTSTVAADNARVEAMGQWTGELAAVIRAGGGVEQTITDSLDNTPVPIRDEVGRLVSRLHAGWDTTAALRAFADDLDDHTGDKIAAALILGTRRRGPRLASFLTDLAGSVAQDVAARRAIDAERAKLRSTARTVTAITAVGIAALLLTPYADFYRTATGQLVLTGLLGLYAGCLVWLRHVTTPPRQPRMLTPAVTPSAGVTKAGLTW